VKEDLRENTRIPFVKPIKYSVIVLNCRELKRICNAAISVDISAGGLGIVTDCPLEAGHVLAFENEVQINDVIAKCAVVRWVDKINGSKYRAGLKFV